MRRTPLSPIRKKKKSPKPKQVKKKTPSIRYQKLYCGNSKMLPNSDYKRRGTSMECLQIGIKTGIGIGRRKEFEELKDRVLRTYSIRIKRRPRKKG